MAQSNRPVRPTVPWQALFLQHFHVTQLRARGGRVWSKAICMHNERRNERRWRLLRAKRDSFFLSLYEAIFVPTDSLEVARKDLFPYFLMVSLQTSCASLSSAKVNLRDHTGKTWGKLQPICCCSEKKKSMVRSNSSSLARCPFSQWTNALSGAQIFSAFSFMFFGGKTS